MLEAPSQQYESKPKDRPKKRTSRANAEKRAIYLSDRGFANPPIGEALPTDLRLGAFGALDGADLSEVGPPPIIGP